MFFFGCLPVAIMDPTAAAGLAFVKRAVLESKDGGNTYDVETEQATGSNGESSSAQGRGPTLYEQLSKKLEQKAEMKGRVEGRAGELTLEDQEFVNRIKTKTDEEHDRVSREETEFKRQRLEKQKAASGIVRAYTSALPHAEISKKAKTISLEGEDATERPVVLVVKKKKRVVEKQ